jgi:hypothetical protein
MQILMENGVFVYDTTLTTAPIRSVVINSDFFYALFSGEGP